MINDKIWKWFDEGNIVNVLIGRKDYFIPDVTFRDRHDLMLVIRQLLLWSKARNDEIHAASEFEKGIDVLIYTKNAEDVLTYLHSYFLVCASDNIALPINEKEILDKITQLINNNAINVVNKENIINIIISLTRLWPVLASNIGLDKK